MPATGLGTVNAATMDGQSNTAQFTLMDTMAPQISSFYAMESTGDMFVFRGHVNNFVAGETVPNLVTVQLSGGHVSFHNSSR